MRTAWFVIAAGLVAGCSANRADPAASVEIGDEYSYSLTTHGGIEWARIGSSWWRTEPLGDGNGNPPAGWDDPVQRGRLRISTANRAVFTGGPVPIELVRTEITNLDDPGLPDSVRFRD